MALVARRQRGGPIVRHQHLAQLRIARKLPHRRAVGDQTVMAMVGARHHDPDHLALELRQAESASIRSLYMSAKACSLTGLKA
jgi:hypothetical protein